MNGAHLHLIVTHLPVLGVLFGTVLLALGLGRGSEFSLRIQIPLGPDPALDRFLHDLFHEEGALEALRFGLAVQEEISTAPAAPADTPGL